MQLVEQLTNDSKFEGLKKVFVNMLTWPTFISIQGASVIKLFTVVNYEWAERARALVSGRSFQPSPVFAEKSRRGQCYETFYNRNLQMNLISLSSPV